MDKPKLTITEEIAQTLFESRDIAVAGHVSPDGDAAASCFALAMSLKKLGKNVTVLLESMPERYGFIKGIELLAKGSCKNFKPDVFVACDCGTKERLGSFLNLFLQTERTVVIDHHISNDSYGALNYLKADASSTAELIYDVVALIGNIDKDIAEALYAGIIFDTGGLRFSSTSPCTLSKIASLMDYGIDFPGIYSRIMLAHTLKEARMLSFAAGKMRFLEGLPVLYTWVTIEDMKKLGCTKDDMEGIVEYMLNTEGAEVAVLVYESGSCSSRASLRSKGPDVNTLAANFGGGGHKAAAGCSIRLNAETALTRILDCLRERYGA